MTLREWYAGLAMQGIVTADHSRDLGIISESAFKIADAMISKSNR
jgi:hypothetical protein